MSHGSVMTLRKDTVVNYSRLRRVVLARTVRFVFCNCDLLLETRVSGSLIWRLTGVLVMPPAPEIDLHVLLTMSSFRQE